MTKTLLAIGTVCTVLYTCNPMPNNKDQLKCDLIGSLSINRYAFIFGLFSITVITSTMPHTFLHFSESEHLKFRSDVHNKASNLGKQPFCDCVLCTERLVVIRFPILFSDAAHFRRANSIMRTSQGNVCAFLRPTPFRLTGKSLRSSRRSVSGIKRKGSSRHTNRQERRCVVMASSARGFGGFLANNSPVPNFRDPLPSPEAQCACGSEKPYRKCCRRFHTAQNSPPLSEELLRSRYSAYAYRLPSYIMKTTHPSLAELDRRNWKREILEFCREYQFVGGVDIIEQQMTGPYTTRILFR